MKETYSVSYNTYQKYIDLILQHTSHKRPNILLKQITDRWIHYRLLPIMLNQKNHLQNIYLTIIF